MTTINCWTGRPLGLVYWSPLEHIDAVLNIYRGILRYEWNIKARDGSILAQGKADTMLEAKAAAWGEVSQ